MIVAENQTTNIVLEHSSESTLSRESDHSYEHVLLSDTEIQLGNISEKASVQTQNSDIISVDVDYVANGTINGEGICWAACIAAVSNRRMGTSYTAETLYHAVAAAYPGYGSPSGTTNWYTRAYSVCGMNAATTTNLTLGALQVIMGTSQKPVICRLESNNQKPNHAVVLEHINITTQRVIYRFMDPNYESPVYYYWDDSVCNPDEMIYDNTADEYSWYASVY